MRVALLFVDGVGIGPKDAERNPLARGDYLLSWFDGDGPPALQGAAAACALDATFGLPGRPQSATNQAALLTGVPVPSRVGRHVLGFPSPPVRAIILRHSIFRALEAMGQRGALVNAYPAGYLDVLGVPRGASARPDVELSPRLQRRARAPATLLALSAGGERARTLDDARAGTGLTHDITGERARARGFDVPLRAPAEAAELFWRVAAGADLTVFDYYLLDEAGHAQDFALAAASLSTLDAFTRALVGLRPADTVVLVLSDHGNVEDLSTRSHTLAKVPLLAFGVHSLPPLTDVADAGLLVRSLLALSGPRDEVET